MLFPEAWTNKKPLGSISIWGKIHFRGVSGLSLNPQPSRLSGFSSGLKISIQSVDSSKLSLSELSFAATISLM